MAKVAVCPDVQALQSLSLGHLSVPEVASVVGHLETCPRCLAKVQELNTGDSLVQSLSKATSLPANKDSEEVAGLIGKLKRLMSASLAAPLSFSCPHCRKALKVKAELAGKKIKCPGCDKAVAVPSGEGATLDIDRTMDIPETAVTNPKRSSPDKTELCESSDEEDNVWSFLASPQLPDELGRLGSYRILQVLGKGGMGVVFRAEDVQLKRMVAIKAMLPAIAANGSAKRRFLREAQTAAGVKHDHIVTIHQVSEDRGVPFLAMEFLTGEPLDVRLKRESKLPIAEVLRIGREVAEGLSAAHDAGLIHRDIKPANIWLEQRGKADPRAKILDFGLARAADDKAEITQQGSILGTPAYMAPEQARGEKVDSRTDLFSLGCVLYVMATGQTPFKGVDTISTLMAVTGTEARPPLEINPEIPQELSELIQRLLTKNPNERPASAQEVVESLRAMEGQGNGVWTVARTESGKGKSRRGLLVACGLAAVAAIVAGIVFFLPAGDGTIRVEVNDDAIEVAVTKTGVKIKTANKQGEVVVSPGEHKLRVKRDGLVFDTDQFVLKKGETVTVKVEWLKDKLVAAKVDGTGLGSKTGEPKPTPDPVAWKPTPEQNSFLDAVVQLPVKNRIDAVTRKMHEVNPLFSERPPATIVLEPKEGEPTRCRVEGEVAYHLWPLAGLTSLTSVDVSATPTIDFRPLARLPLTELKANLILDNVTSENTLKEMKSLKKVNDRPAAEFWSERADIRKDIDKMAGISKALPLEDQQTWLRSTFRKLHPHLPEAAFNTITLIVAENKLVRFRAYDLDRGVYDFSPVRGVAIEDFFLMGGSLSDATPLAKTKIKVYNQTKGSGVRDLTPFAGLPLTEMHIGALGHAPISDLRPLSGAPLKILNASRTLVADLASLKGMPLESLGIAHTGVTDLSPLAGMKLKVLDASNTTISDLTPLKGMPLESLNLFRARVSDLSPVAGMKLKVLEMGDLPVVDLTPLKDMPLTTLVIGRAHLDPVLATIPLKELEVNLRLYSEAEEKILRGLKLEKINGMKPDDFWKDVEKRRKVDADKTAEMTKVPLEAAALEKALWICGQYPKVKIEEGAVIEASAGHCNGGLDNPFAVFLAFPKLRKLKLESGGDYSALAKLPLLEELECAPLEVRFNLPILRAMPKLKTINGKPAAKALDALAKTATPK